MGDFIALCFLNVKLRPVLYAMLLTTLRSSFSFFHVFPHIQPTIDPCVLVVLLYSLVELPSDPLKLLYVDAILVIVVLRDHMCGLRSLLEI